MATNETIQQVRDELNRMRGHLFETVEAMALPEGQEHGAKGLIRTITYNSQANIESALREEKP